MGKNVQLIPVHYLTQYWGPYRYVMERISTAHTGKLWKVLVQPYRYVMESISITHNGTLWKVLVQPIPVRYRQQ